VLPSIFLESFFSLSMIFFIRNNEECACLKEQHLFETEIFCNIINVFTVILDQFNASLPKKLLKQMRQTRHLQ